LAWRVQIGNGSTEAAENMNHKPTNTSLRFVGEANFNSHVSQSKGAFLVAFWAPWSKPCQVIDPVLLEVAQTCAGKIEVVKVNADDNPNLSMWFGVQNIPTLLHFEAGQLRGQLVGTVSKDAILKLLSRNSEAGRGDVSSEKGEAI
jgi:thioredoxin 1